MLISERLSENLSQRLFKNVRRRSYTSILRSIGGPVWQCLRSWLRIIRQGVALIELVVKIALRHQLPEFLLVGAETAPIAKFIVDHLAPDWGKYQDKLI